MKKTLIAALALGLFVAIAQANVTSPFLINPVPLGSDPTNSAAGVMIPGDGLYDGGVFQVGAGGSQISNFEVWLVSNQNLGDNQTGGSATDPSGSATLYLADLTTGGAWTDASTLAASSTGNQSAWSTAYSRFYYSDGTNYYSTTDNPGQYMPMYQVSMGGGGVDLNATDTYAWAVAFGEGTSGTLLASSQAACNAASSESNPLICDISGGSNYGNMIGWSADLATAPTGTAGDLINGINGQPYLINGAPYDTNFAMSPEPGTWLLIAAGAGVLAIARRRKV